MVPLETESPTEMGAPGMDRLNEWFFILEKFCFLTVLVWCPSTTGTGWS